MPASDVSLSSSFSGSSDHGAESPVHLEASVNEFHSFGSLGSEPDSTRLDSERHPKGKRKRTAAKDKSVLESAYNSNPKPDKAARLDIVKRVSLNEKEVQIWFQNRRQNDRRKSRPLSAQEIAALRYGGMQILSSDPASYGSSHVDEKQSSPSEAALPATDGQIRNTLKINSQDVLEQMEVVPPGTTDCSMVENRSKSSNDSEPTSSQESDTAGPMMSVSFSSSIGYLSNRWNLGSSLATPSTLRRDGDDTLKLEPCVTSFCSSSASAGPILPPPQSHVRLSLSLEGKAELVANENSPPRLQIANPLSTATKLPQVRPQSLQRSHSALPSITLPPISALTEFLPPPLSRGRSRDAHAWELCCDADTRDELTTQAENESNGSAVAAISLLRSTGSMLQINGSKRNAPASKPISRPHNSKKPKLARTSSSAARIQTVSTSTDSAGHLPQKDKSLLERKLNADTLVSPSGDSDKENWSPDEKGNPRQHPTLLQPRRPLPATAPRLGNPRRAGRVLQEHQGPALLGSARANTAPVRAHGDGAKWQQLEIFEDTENQPLPKPEEVERFMRGEVSPSKKGDMDCVAGLLSLSQGNWR